MILQDIVHALNDPRTPVSDPAAVAGVEILMAVAASVAGYDDQKAELTLMAEAVRLGAARLSDDRTLVTVEELDRTAMLLEAIAAAI